MFSERSSENFIELSYQGRVLEIPSWRLSLPALATVRYLCLGFQGRPYVGVGELEREDQEHAVYHSTKSP